MNFFDRLSDLFSEVEMPSDSTIMTDTESNFNIKPYNFDILEDYIK